MGDIVIAEAKPLADMANAELRIELAYALSEKPKTWRASTLKQKRIAAITRELVERGAF